MLSDKKSEHSCSSTTFYAWSS